MYGHDPRFFSAGYTQFGMGMENPQTAWYGQTQPAFYGAGVNAPTWTTRPQYIANHQATMGLNTQEMISIQQQLNEVRYTLGLMTEMLRSDLTQRTSQNFGINQSAMNATTNSVLNFPFGFRVNGIANNDVVRLRESETNLFCEIFLPHLTVGEIELETIGNRIVCRTRVPVALNHRYLFTAGQLPRHFEVFEVPDGRLEFSWTCPVQFHGKDVEATYRDGYICICIPKIEAVALKHTVKSVKDSTTRRAAGDISSQ